MRRQTVIQELAFALQAYRNCTTSDNEVWRDRWEARIDYIARNLLPSGSGVDCGTTVQRGLSTKDKVVLTTSFHHMDENGMYDGWTEHSITVRPSFDGINLSIGGRNRNDIKDYLHELYDVALREDFGGYPDDL